MNDHAAAVAAAQNFHNKILYLVSDSINFPIWKKEREWLIDV